MVLQGIRRLTDVLKLEKRDSIYSMCIVIEQPCLYAVWVAMVSTRQRWNYWTHCSCHHFMALKDSFDPNKHWNQNYPQSYVEISSIIYYTPVYEEKKLLMVLKHFISSWKGRLSSRDVNNLIFRANVNLISQNQVPASRRIISSSWWTNVHVLGRNTREHTK